METDILVIGAGPAGLCAALRLLQLKYRVVLVERSGFPKANIGESLTPGVHDILEQLDACNVIADAGRAAVLGTRLIWEAPKEELIRSDRNDGNTMIDRALFDASLLELCKKRGAVVMQQTTVRSKARHGDLWHVTTGSAGHQQSVAARFILDARGRGGCDEYVKTGPALLAIWAEVSQESLPTEVFVEATRNAWLWGSPISSGAYRIMAFSDPSTPRHFSPGKPEKWFRAKLAQSKLFKRFMHAKFGNSLRACAATPYFNADWWSVGSLKLGDAAFTLDPISTSGVEKAMRFSLQASIAVNTLLLDQQSEPVVHSFMEARIIESCVRHMCWTQEYYGQAWPGLREEFWAKRVSNFKINTPQESLQKIFNDTCAKLHASTGITRRTHEPSEMGRYDLLVLSKSPRLSPDISVQMLPCAVDTHIEVRTAIGHPNLERSIAYLQGKELAPLLCKAATARTFEELIGLWSKEMPNQLAVEIASWLLRKGILYS